MAAGEYISMQSQRELFERQIALERAEMEAMSEEEEAELFPPLRNRIEKDVWAEMDRRERLFGIAEKVPKTEVPPSERRKVVALDHSRARKRR